MRTTVHVDFNDLARDGKVVALKEWANGPIAVGDLVTLVDQFDDELTMRAVVAEQDDSGQMYLDFTPPVVDNVVYSRDPRKSPEWQYQVVDRKDFGLGGSFEAVRKLYHSRNPVRGPLAVEHFQQYRDLGYWLRTRGPANEESTLPIRTFVATFDNQNRSVRELSPWGISSNGEPLVIGCLPSDTIQSVLDQITDHDSVVVTMAIPNGPGGRLISATSSLAGSKAPRPAKQSYRTLADVGLGLESTILELMETSGIFEELKRLEKQDVELPKSLKSAGRSEIIMSGRLLIAA
ncbi:hypothetical protein ABZ319_00515 [Nocardia sp. NPDC005978]|uniref:hypothetical protein n=1 Tax=Nocardia sp. NPDC005978 TaxID=3156725 RepID=UPI0033BEE5F9